MLLHYKKIKDHINHFNQILLCGKLDVTKEQAEVKHYNL